MRLHRHHTRNDIVTLDILLSNAPVAGSGSLAITGSGAAGTSTTRGSYIEAGPLRCLAYWTHDERFVFQTSDGYACEIAYKAPDGRMHASQPGLQCIITPLPRTAQGRPGMSEVALVSAQGEVLYRITYNAEYYRRLHAFDFTAASSEQDLSDWDFFVALKKRIDEAAQGSAAQQGQQQEARA